MLFNPNTRKRKAIAAVLAAGLVGGGAGGAIAAGAGAGAPQAETREHLRFTNPTKITNPWLPLSATPRTELAGIKDGKQSRSVKTLLKRTEPFKVQGQKIRAAIVEDRAYVDGVLHEVALDYYAQADDGTVYYLGEDVDIYDKKGKRVVSHDGAFRYGTDTKVLGVAMPAHPRVGQKFTFEDVPRVGSERNRVVRTNDRVEVPGGSFKRALKVTARLVPDNENEAKWYVRGVGMVKEQGVSGSVGLVAAQGR